MGYSKRSVFQTLAYFDIFGYPLTFEELFEYFPEKTDKKFLQKKAGKRKFYFLKGRSKTVSTRLRREKESNRKLHTSQKVSKILSFIPTVQLIAVSGALSMKIVKRMMTLTYL